ncbi:uncharacterized protein LOC119109038 [Pollicipes pollicipes]|uniref:uncharacterized protein LOC119109038 n=1 Tax=Pollicipes pollicipes TaxID=41117 RepID=UPI001885A1D4|nr:uncharacterized protein LOC119109038 [Pollicipes pollicipes]
MSSLQTAVQQKAAKGGAMETDGERSLTDSDDGSSASWVILSEDGHIEDDEGAYVDGAGAAPESEPEPRAADGGDPVAGVAGADGAPAEEEMTHSGGSDSTVVERCDVAAGGAAAADGAERVRLEEGSDIEVIPGEHHEDEYFEDDPMDLCPNDSDEEAAAVQLLGSLPSDTVLRRRPGRDRDRAEPDRDQPDPDGRDPDQRAPDQRDRAEPDPGRRDPVQRDPDQRDRWAEDTDLSSQPEQMVPDEVNVSRLRHYVHQRNNAVNHLLTVLLVLCVTCVVGFGVGHFLGWIHHHEMTEEIVHSLDEKLDVLRDDLMTCMTTEDDQDLDNKWIKELLNENEALLHQLQGDDGDGPDSSHCSEGYARLRDQVNQLRMENDELKANIAKMRYGTASQDGHVLRRHRDQINQLVTENGELARELRRTRYVQPLTEGRAEAGPAVLKSPDSDDSTTSPAVDDTSSSSSSSEEQETEDESSTDEGGLLSVLLGWRPAEDSEPLQGARRRLWSLWQEATDFSRAEPASKYVKMAGKTMAKVEKTLLRAYKQVREFGEAILEDAEGGGGAEKVAAKLGRKVDKVVARLDAQWQRMRQRWTQKVEAKEAGGVPHSAPAQPVVIPPPGPPPNATDPSVAAFYARRSRHRHRARQQEQDEPANWQLSRAQSRAERRGAKRVGGGSWLLERARARQQFRRRRGEEEELPRPDKRWREERQRQRGDWQALDDDDDDWDDDDDDYGDHAARVARLMQANARFQENIQKTVQRHAAKINRKVRENHWKHFAGRKRHEYPNSMRA